MNRKEKSPTPHFDRIEPQYCLNAKLRRLHKMVSAAYERQLKPYGLQGSMLSILFIIGKRKHINQKSLADILLLDPSTMSRDLKKLADKGWVSVQKGADARHTELEISPQGQEFLEVVAPVWERLHQSMEAILGKYQIVQIDQITDAVRTHLDEIG